MLDENNASNLWKEDKKHQRLTARMTDPPPFSSFDSLSLT